MAENVRQTNFLKPGQKVEFDATLTLHGEREALISEITRLLGRKTPPDTSVTDRIIQIMKERQGISVNSAIQKYFEEH